MQIWFATKDNVTVAVLTKCMTNEHGDIEITWQKWTYVEVDLDGAKKRIDSCIPMTLSGLIDKLVTDLQQLPVHLIIQL